MARRPRKYLSRKAALAVVILFSSFLCLILLAPQSAAGRAAMVCALVTWAGLSIYCLGQIVIGTAGTVIRSRAVNRISRLIVEGQADEACAYSRRQLEKYPNDPWIRINATAAFHKAGRPDEAREIFEALAPGSVPSTLIPVYEYWRQIFEAPVKPISNTP